MLQKASGTSVPAVSLLPHGSFVLFHNGTRFAFLFASALYGYAVQVRHGKGFLASEDKAISKNAELQACL